MIRSLHQRKNASENDGSLEDSSNEHRCNNEDLWKIRHELDLAQIRIYYLKKQLLQVTSSKQRSVSVNRSEIFNLYFRNIVSI